MTAAKVLKIQRNKPRLTMFLAISFLLSGCGVFWGGVTYRNTGAGAFVSSQYGVAGLSTSPGTNGSFRDSQGNFYISGATTGNLGGTIQGSFSANKNNLYLYMLNPTGTLQWTTQLGASGSDIIPYCMVGDNQGGLYVTGYTNASISGSTQYGTHGTDDLFVAKFSTNGGQLQWVSQLGIALQTTEARCLTFDSANSLYVSGYTTGSTVGAPLFGTQYGSHGIEDSLVAKFSSSGVLQWVSQLGAAGSTTTYGITLDGAGYLYVTGWTNAFLGGTQYGALGNQDIWIGQYTTGGVFQWESQAGVALATAQGTTLLTDKVGGLYIVGQSNGSYTAAPFFGTQYGTHGTTDLILTKFNTAGSFEWISQLGAGLKATSGIHGLQNSAGDLYVTGYTSGYLGGIQYGTSGGTDLIFSKFSSAGVLGWVNQLGDSGTNSYGQSIIEDAANIFYIIGNSSDVFGGTQYGSHGTQDSAISEFSITGAYP